MTETDSHTANTGKPRKERQPREISNGWLRDQALRYLNRFAATTRKLEQHLLRKSAPAMEHFSLDPETVRDMIRTEIGKLETAGILNDRDYANSKARSMARQGKSDLQIRLKLSSLGFEEPEVETVMTHLREEEGHSNRIAAAKYIRKRRFGAFRTNLNAEDRLEKEKASLVRNGFPFTLAEQLLQASKDELEDIIYSSNSF
ncbi:RecX family transcriptional regulator [Sneathiella chinensis]|uniref:Regulatory protein RecX n=1 Tax=Sneathiella chinensis TaxID=349750 RepID=A0ABQ5U6E5_9PROT|nr:RecX family transcriptional regulator [Sneathiella chinensis]GLQ07258.1 hypothetical protein GCM10007924_24790 [Sneathiella chinensis]